MNLWTGPMVKRKRYCVLDITMALGCTPVKQGYYIQERWAICKQRDKALWREFSQGVGRALCQRIFIKSMLYHTVYVLIFFQ